MEKNDSDSGSDNLVVGLRRPHNQTDVRTRHMAFDAKAIRIVREMETMINLLRLARRCATTIAIPSLARMLSSKESGQCGGLHRLW